MPQKRIRKQLTKRQKTVRKVKEQSGLGIGILSYYLFGWWLPGKTGDSFRREMARYRRLRRER